MASRSLGELRVPRVLVPSSDSASSAVAAPHQLLLLLTLATVQFTHIVDFMVIMPLGPQFMRLFDMGPREFGLLISSYTFAAAVSGFVAAFWIDRFDRKRALLALRRLHRRDRSLRARADVWIAGGDARRRGT